MRVAVIGSCLVDLSVRPAGELVPDTSNQAEIVWGAGGAGRNVAENLARLGAEVTMVTDLGGDLPARGAHLRLAHRHQPGPLSRDLRGGSTRMNDLVVLSEEVAAALATGRAVVALESTVISHGMPYPENVATAASLEAAVREQGAVPATIAVLDGRIRVGLSSAEIERLGDGRTPVAKLSRRDLPLALAAGTPGATTVAATMIAARAAGIRVFATGGIGGVHRGAAESFDISADLAELARTSVAVVCAGAKAILDMPRTLELLETLGVPVLGFGTDEFPAFYSRSSGLPVDARVDTPGQVAAICRAKWELGLEGGVLIANPVPAEHEVPREVIGEAIAAALADARREGITGKAVTPYLLARVNARTGGAALAANVALIRSNAALAARIARALAD